MITKIFPAIMVLLSLGAASVYLAAGWQANWRMVLYWGAASVITTVVTW